LTKFANVEVARRYYEQINYRSQPVIPKEAPPVMPAIVEDNLTLDDNVTASWDGLELEYEELEAWSVAFAPLLRLASTGDRKDFLAAVSMKVHSLSMKVLLNTPFACRLEQRTHHVALRIIISSCSYILAFVVKYWRILNL
jgi:hypothetical protein